MKFSIKGFSLRMWSHLQGKSLMENFIICTVNNYSYLSTERKNDIIQRILSKTNSLLELQLNKIGKIFAAEYIIHIFIWMGSVRLNRSPKLGNKIIIRIILRMVAIIFAKSFEIARRQRQAPSLPSRNKTLAIALKKCSVVVWFWLIPLPYFFCSCL